MNGTVTVLDKGEVRIHSYMAPEKSVNVTSQIIETPERLIVVDGQFLGPFADEAAEYARSLGKPIDRLVITHGHPDHYAAAARWGAPLVSLPEVRDAILARGDVHLPTGGLVPVADVTPDGSVRVGEEVVDGVLLTFEHVVGGEAHDQLLIALPDHGVLIAQDLVYHDVHLYFGERDIDGWQRAVSLLAQAEGYDTVLAGHGLPTTRRSSANWSATSPTPRSCSVTTARPTRRPSRSATRSTADSSSSTSPTGPCSPGQQADPGMTTGREAQCGPALRLPSARWSPHCSGAVVRAAPGSSRSEPGDDESPRFPGGSLLWAILGSNQ